MYSSARVAHAFRQAAVQHGGARGASSHMCKCPHAPRPLTFHKRFPHPGVKKKIKIKLALTQNSAICRDETETRLAESPLLCLLFILFQPAGIFSSLGLQPPRCILVLSQTIFSLILTPSLLRHQHGFSCTTLLTERQREPGYLPAPAAVHTDDMQSVRVT